MVGEKCSAKQPGDRGGFNEAYLRMHSSLEATFLFPGGGRRTDKMIKRNPVKKEAFTFMSLKFVPLKMPVSIVLLWIILFAWKLGCAKPSDLSSEIPLQMGPGSEYAGNLFFADSDIEIQTSLDVQLAIRRAYNSRSRRMGIFGKGWICDPLDIKIEKEKNGKLILISEDGQEEIYTSENGTDFFPQPKTDMIGHKLLTLDERTYLLLLRNGGQWRFNTHGYLISKKDTLGNELSIKRADDGITPIHIEGPLGQKIHFRVRDSKVMTAEGPGGVQFAYSYDNSGRLIRRINPIGQETVYRYSRAGQLNAYHTLGGPLHKFSFENGLLSKRSTAGVESYTYRYLPIDSGHAGDYTQEVSDESGQIVRKIEVRKAGRERIAFDAQGNQTILCFDKSWRLVSRKRPIGKEERWNFSPKGVLESYDDILGTQTTYQWSTDGRELTVAGPRGSETVYEYRLLSGLLQRITDQWGISTRFVRDDRGRIVEIIYDNQQILKLRYDEYGYIEQTKGVEGAWKYERDPFGNITRIIDGEGGERFRRVDMLGRPIFSDDGEGRTVRWSYDNKGRLISIMDGEGHSIKFGLADDGSIKNLTDANENRYGFDYEKGLLSSLTFPKGTSEAIRIDQFGQIKEVKNQQGQDVRYERDRYGRVIRQCFKDECTSWTYNALGQLAEASNTYSSYRIKYNRFGDTEQIRDGKGRTLRYEYNDTGQRVSMIDPEGGKTSYAYDRRGNLAKIIGPGGEEYVFEYDSVGRLLRREYPNGIVARFSYDRRGALSSILTVDRHGKDLYSVRLTRDRSGKIIRLQDNEGIWLYQYDLAGRLTSAKGPGGFEESSTYDAAGNRISHQVEEKKKSLRYGDLNELLADGEYEYAYNEDGQLITRSDGTIYKYNPLGKLVAIKNARGKAIDYVYDPFGRLIGKTVDGKRIEYLYDKEDIIAEYNHGEPSPEVRYVHGPGIDEPLSFRINGKLDTYILGLNNSVERIYDHYGELVQDYALTPFGQFMRGTDSVNNPYIFNARRWDDEAELYYFRARFFDQRTGRFISPDPIRFRGGWNLYVYANNDPVNLIDYFGLLGVTFSVGGTHPGWVAGPGLIGGVNLQYFGPNDPRNGVYLFSGPGLFYGGGAGISANYSKNYSDDPYLPWEGGFGGAGLSWGRPLLGLGRTTGRRNLLGFEVPPTTYGSTGLGVSWSQRTPWEYPQPGVEGEPQPGWAAFAPQIVGLPSGGISGGVYQTYYVHAWQTSPNLTVKSKTLDPVNPRMHVGESIEFKFKMTVASPSDPNTINEDDLTKIAKWYWIDWDQRPHQWNPCNDPATCKKNTFTCTEKGEYGIRANYFSEYIQDPQESNLHGASASTDIICLGKDETPPVLISGPKDRIQFSHAVYRAEESAGTTAIAVVRIGEGKGDISVQYLTEDETAKAGAHSGEGDYDRTGYILTWKKGDFEPQKFHVFINDDNLVEGDEIVRLKLRDPDGHAILGDRSEALLVIEDDDDHGTLGFTKEVYRVAENAGSIDIEVKREDGTRGIVTVDYETIDDTAKAGIDYIAVSDTLTWQDRKSDPKKPIFTVSIIDNDLVDGDRTVSLELRNPTGGAKVGRSKAILIIEDDDTKSVEIQRAVFDPPEYEVDEGVGTVTVWVRRVGGTRGVFKVDCYTQDSSAQEGSDYYGKEETLIWGPGDDESKPFRVSIIDDREREVDESIFLRLESPRNTEVKVALDEGAEGTIIVKDNDEELTEPRACKYLRVTPQKAVARTGKPDSISFKAFAVFEDGTQQDVTTDPRTIWKPGLNNTYTPPRDLLFTESVTIEAEWLGCKGTAEVTALVGPVSRADQLDSEAPPPPADAYKWYALCNKKTGEVTYGKYSDPTKHIVMDGPFPGPRTARQWIEKNCPNWRCTIDGLCATTPAPTGVEGWYVLCRKQTGSVTIGKQSDIIKHIIMAGPFLGEPDARNWIAENCPNRRCTNQGQCGTELARGGEWYVLCSKAHGGIHLGKNPDSMKFWIMEGPFLGEPDARNWVDGDCPSWRCDRDGRCLAGIGREALGERPLETPSDVIAMFEEREQRRNGRLTGQNHDAGTGRSSYEEMTQNLDGTYGQMRDWDNQRDRNRDTTDGGIQQSPPRHEEPEPPSTGSRDSEETHYFLVEVVVETESSDERCIETVRYPDKASSREEVKARAKDAFRPKAKIKRIISIKIDGPYDREPSFTPPPLPTCTPIDKSRGSQETSGTQSQGKGYVAYYVVPKASWALENTYVLDKKRFDEDKNEKVVLAEDSNRAGAIQKACSKLHNIRSWRQGACGKVADFGDNTICIDGLGGCSQ
jgi:RHS repeat-associated protein